MGYCNVKGLTEEERSAEETGKGFLMRKEVGGKSEDLGVLEFKWKKGIKEEKTKDCGKFCCYFQ